ncbi:DCC1-like thiol-disulfide oxidoreductase family protein [Rhizobium sp. 18065]|uniref:DCC1-like thiol-disulfide oxidoreductase family protein n=1 Tax=Rhizobium sp. 18065 TaxID=2681411 RepID=UPI001357059C|nr:DCC1-like thiol-disulfide oxidoreductase family protein [Rhizobium sp. 18065]
MSDTFIRSTHSRQSWPMRNTILCLALLSAVAAAALSATWIFGATRWHGARLVVFFLMLGAAIGVMGLPSVGAAVTAALNKIAAALEQRGSFHSNAVAEAPKFALIRIAFGTLLTIRALWLIYYMSYSDWADWHVAIPAISAAACGLLVTIGFFTQPTLIFLMLFQWHIGDAFLASTTLGNDVAAAFSLLLIFANAGAHLSFDSQLRRSRLRLGSIISATYYRDGLPSTATLQIAKLVSLSAYWCVCLYSLGIHLGEPAWMQGYAGAQLLANEFMSRFGSEFAQLFSSSTFAVVMSRFALWAMLPWYLLLLPCVLIGGLFRTYAITWGLLFFLLSCAVLRLGWLAEFEFLFFAALFWSRAFLAGGNRLQVAYDDRCNLCDRTIQFIKFVDVFGRVQMRPLSKNEAWLRSVGIDPADAQKDLYGYKSGSSTAPSKGYDFYLLLTRDVLLLLPLYPVLLIGSFLGGRSVYRFVADRRTAMFGVCQIPSSKREYSYTTSEGAPPVSIKSGDIIGPVFIQLVGLAIAYVVTIPTPYLFMTAPQPVQSVLGFAKPLANAAHIYGITPINVFNRTDLAMAENWFTISAIAADGSERLLPILNEKGQRLEAHRSDRIYFGNTLKFRRAVIGTDKCEYLNYQKMMTYLVASVSDEQGSYLYRQYHQPLASPVDINAGTYIQRPSHMVCEIVFNYTR